MNKHLEEKQMTRKFSTLAAAAAIAVVAFATAPAFAVEETFSGGINGIDPLTGNWHVTSSPLAWGEPGDGLGTLNFNTGDTSNGAGDFATGFDFAVTRGLDGSIDQADTEF